MTEILNIKKNKILIYSLVMNLIFLLIFLYSILDRTGGWGNIDVFIKLIFLFPILVFVVSFIFSSFNEKLKFTYLSFLIYGIIVINQLNLLSLKLNILVKLTVLVVSPLILVFFQYGLHMIFRKIKDVK